MAPAPPARDGSAPPTGDQPSHAATPRLRGWIHAVMAPLSLVVAVVLVIGTSTTPGTVTTAIFGFTTVLLFTTSAIYHRGTWSPPVHNTLRRIDHSNIFLVIAGTYTPLAALLLPESTARVLLIVVWSGALIGLLARIFWLGAPRWFYVPVYVALGWVALWFLPDFWAVGSPAIALLVIAGGVGYTVGALAYAFKRPNPVPDWFGFHELFHTGTVVGYLCHAAAIGIAAIGH
ncbi:PAQR family membrane homeostasis protein TrhA [Ruania halotolerans]|uniref:PAQR family membrane homeostasis protein TrhA n=1 Tax=Ruania halotolerans TaxID=2897773 RepID=UPI001E531B0C|nr:hemolysin III family protein [Ruania halotolerans]UFU07451.1 hemolysin III family protein [Ruania halotolerans]